MMQAVAGGDGGMFWNLGARPGIECERGVGPTPRRFHESGVSIPSGRVTLENFLPFGRFPKTRRTLYVLLEMQLVFDFQSTPSQSG